MVKRTTIIEFGVLDTSGKEEEVYKEVVSIREALWTEGGRFALEQTMKSSLETHREEGEEEQATRMEKLLTLLDNVTDEYDEVDEDFSEYFIDKFVDQDVGTAVISILCKVT